MTFINPKHLAVAASSAVANDVYKRSWRDIFVIPRWKAANAKNNGNACGCDVTERTGFPPPLAKPAQKKTLRLSHIFHKLGDARSHTKRKVREFDPKIASYLAEAIHFGNDFDSSVASLRTQDAFPRNRWMLSIGITGWLHRSAPQHIQLRVGVVTTTDSVLKLSSFERPCTCISELDQSLWSLYEARKALTR